MSSTLEISREQDMAFPRSKYVREGKEGMYHCFARGVRRAFLYGFDPITGRNFSYRKAWLIQRLQRLASIFPSMFAVE